MLLWYCVFCSVELNEHCCTGIEFSSPMNSVCCNVVLSFTASMQIVVRLWCRQLYNSRLFSSNSNGCHCTVVGPCLKNRCNLLHCRVFLWKISKIIQTSLQLLCALPWRPSARAWNPPARPGFHMPDQPNKEAPSQSTAKRLLFVLFELVDDGDQML